MASGVSLSQQALRIGKLALFLLLTLYLATPAFLDGGLSENNQHSSDVRAYKQEPGPFQVRVLLFDWTDAKRSRTVPVKIYFPSPARTSCPLIILSHGLGGSRQGYRYLGEHWATHGYISLHVQHPGSDESAWKGQPRPLSSMKRLRPIR